MTIPSERWKLNKMKAEINDLKAKNKKLKKDLLVEKVKSRDRKIYIQPRDE